MLIWDALIFPFKGKNSFKNFLPFIIIACICLCFSTSPALESFIKGLPLAGSILCSIIVYIICSLYPTGYLIVLCHNKINDKEEVIPKWYNFINFSMKGFSIVIITHIYLFLFSIILFLIVLIAIAIGVVFPVLSAFQDLIFILLVIMSGILLISILLIVTMAYAENFDFSDAFCIYNIFSTLSRNIPALLLLYFYIGILFLLFAIVSIIFWYIIKVEIVNSLVFSLIWSYFSSCVAYLAASYYLKKIC